MSCVAFFINDEPKVKVKMEKLGTWRESANRLLLD